MEAFAAAASVAGLISLAIRIPKLIDSAACVWSAPDEAGQLSRMTDALFGVDAAEARSLLQRPAKQGEWAQQSTRR